MPAGLLALVLLLSNQRSRHPPLGLLAGWELGTSALVFALSYGAFHLLAGRQGRAGRGKYAVLLFLMFASTTNSGWIPVINASVSAGKLRTTTGTIHQYPNQRGGDCELALKGSSTRFKFYCRPHFTHLRELPPGSEVDLEIRDGLFGVPWAASITERKDE